MILSVELSVLTSLIGLSLIKHNSDTFIQKPIISGDNLWVQIIIWLLIDNFTTLTNL